MKKVISSITTIKISKTLVEKLSSLKIHPRQSYAEVIQKLLNNYKEKNNEEKPNLYPYEKPKSITTIKISKSLVKELSNLKIHPRQSYAEVINILFEEYKKDEKR